MATLSRSKADSIRQRQQFPTANLRFSTGDRAVVANAITPGCMGRIYYQSTYWNGYTADSLCLAEGSVVQVLERRGNTWLVRSSAS